MLAIAPHSRIARVIALATALATAAAPMSALAQGGIPLIRPLRESLAGAHIDRIHGIVNGTTNFILSEMTRTGCDYEQALAQSQPVFEPFVRVSLANAYLAKRDVASARAQLAARSRPPAISRRSGVALRSPYFGPK